MLVNDNLSFGIDIEDDFAVISLDRLLAVATERLARNATAAMVKHVLIFMEIVHLRVITLAGAIPRSSRMFR